MFFDLLTFEEVDAGHSIESVNTVEAKKLRYRYPLTDKYVLRDIDVVIRRGEKVALVGENGAGKTTFVKLVSGMLHPSDGLLLINGIPVEEIRLASRYGAMSAVCQDPARYNTFTVADNVHIGDTARARDEGEIEAALASAGFDGLRAMLCWARTWAALSFRAGSGRNLPSHGVGTGTGTSLSSTNPHRTLILWRKPISSDGISRCPGTAR